MNVRFKIFDTIASCGNKLVLKMILQSQEKKKTQISKNRRILN